MVFFMLFGCPTANFGPFLRILLETPYVNHCAFTIFDLKVTGSLVMRLHCQAGLMTWWSLNQEPSNSIMPYPIGHFPQSHTPQNHSPLRPLSQVRIGNFV